ncbi:MAG: 3-phosphoglycerate dehydrogenase [Deltaproteobacteria bacterium]|nr:3-phosphoglycerate dehydrogenase [Deltaproteobacteria bacterium]MBW2018244.1 3-phosphoglycerate dehydrogenase [Deltaproteobacteria bacterium]MBW2130429.1 3-phosphoglycerate dehydrogenase [Deltaproteobacteria bacterium]MBW2303813.1 3-phosphoglycerate dehydrogenase [Deltaproteobacteria bacterium]
MTTKKVLIATKKPFAESARNTMVQMFKEAGLEPVVLEKYEDPGELLSAVSDVAAMVIRSDKVTEEVLDAAKELKLVVRAGAGYDNVDCEAAKSRGVIVENTPGQNANAVAELTIGLMVMMARGKYSGKPGTELRGKKLGVHAYGNIGKIVASLAKGFGMEVCAFDPFIDRCVFDENGVECMSCREDLYACCDYVSLHIPATPETVQSINYDILSRMKESATLINTARAEVIHEEDLLRIMEERPGFKYASDIAPKNADILLEKFPDRVFFTPKKMGAQTLEANTNAGLAAAQQVIDYLKEGKILNRVNP